MRRALALFLLCLLPVLTACGGKPAEAPATPVLNRGITWTGTELKGLRFYQRVTEHAVVHYALPTTPDTAERVANQVGTFWTRLLKEERSPRISQTHIWLVPLGYAWPAENLPQLRAGWAAGPGLLVVDERATGNLTWLDRVLFPAFFEGPGSPVFAVDWLQDGHGVALTQALNTFPAISYMEGVVPSASAALARIRNKAEYYFNGCTALAALLIDRYGFDWTYHYPKKPEELTPELALQWATGASTTEAALELWDKRMAYARRAAGLPTNQREATGHAAMISPLRMEPTLPANPKGPGAAANFSRSAYDLTLRLEPAEGVLTGEERLTWQNGEGIPVDALYFNLWPNSEPMTMLGGFMKIEGVTVSGSPVPFESRAIDLKVPLGRPVAPGETVEVGIRFTTRLTGSTTKPLGHVGTDRFFLGRFYPILGVLDDRGWNLHALHSRFGDPYSEPADYRVSLDVPAGIPLGATGRLTGREERSDRWIYQYEAKAVPEWAAAGGARFAEAKGTAGGVAITVLDADEKWAAKVLDGAKEAATFLQSQLGPMPSPGVTIVRSMELELPDVVGVDELDTVGYWKNVLTHRLAHEWFGGLVGSDQWSEAWLDEGLARFMERRAARAFERFQSMNNVRESDLPRHDLISRSGMDFLARGEYGDMTFTLGAYVFEQLEKEIGAAAMNRLLRQWIATYGGTTATGADFVRMAEAVAGRPLGAFFEANRINPAAARVPYKTLMPLGATQP